MRFPRVAAQAPEYCPRCAASGVASPLFASPLTLQDLTPPSK
jgi:hypothetical protein